jgi:hypothetical protein
MTAEETIHSVTRFVIARSVSSEAIQSLAQAPGLLRFARNDEGSRRFRH